MIETLPNTNSLSWLQILLVLAVILVFIAHNVILSLRRIARKSVQVVDPPVINFKRLKLDIPINTAYTESKQKKKRKARAMLTPVPYVDFDPTNVVHQAALYEMMMYGRQHTLLRFNYDPSAFSCAFDACLFAMANHAIPPGAQTIALADLKSQRERKRKSRSQRERTRSMNADIQEKRSSIRNTGAGVTVLPIKSQGSHNSRL